MDIANNIGGVQATEIAQQFGTPVYVYNADTIKHQFEKLKSAFSSSNTKFHYALKALNNINILKLLKKQGAGLDAVSITEVELGLRAGFTPDKIMYTPNCVSFAEIKQAVELGVHINIDNLATLELFGAEYGNKVPCCIRLNPHIMAGGHTHISVGHIDSKFGISIYQVPHIKRIVESLNIKVNGLHMHTGSDILDSGVFLQGAQLLFNAAQNFPDLQFMDFGSGFKVAYKEGDVVTDIQTLGEEVCTAFNDFCHQYGRQLELWFEPGKYLVSQSGYLLVEVNVVKQTTSTVFVGVNSGQNHLIRPMFYDAYHHIENISNVGGKKRVYSVVGYICETDTLGYDRQLSEVREGDVLAIHNAGAYGFSMANNYNARLRPAEVLVKNGKAQLIRNRETLDDLIKGEIDLEN